MQHELIRMEHATQTIRGEKVLDDFKLNLFCGEIISLVGVRDFENDCLLQLFSGQSTLAKGSFLLEDKPLDLTHRALPASVSISCIRKQHNLIAQLSIGENLFVVKRNARKLYLNTYAVRQQTRCLLEKAGLPLQETDLAAHLTPAQSHCIEILRAMVQSARLLVLEDIAESYTEEENEQLCALLKQATAQGISVLYLSFYPSAVFSISQRISLMRKGRHIRTYAPEELSLEALTDLVRQLNHSSAPPSIHHSAGGVLFEIRQLCYSFLQTPLNISLHRGEILGYYDNGTGVAHELIGCLFTACNWPDGSLLLEEKPLARCNTASLAKKGVMLIPGFAEQSAYLHNLSPQENLFLPLMPTSSLPCFLKNERVQHYAWHSFQEILAQYFSADFIQGKYLEVAILYYRCVLSRPRLMVCENPYRGADALMRKIVATFLRIAAAEGISVMVFSHAYEDLLTICDRVLELK